MSAMRRGAAIARPPVRSTSQRNSSGLNPDGAILGVRRQSSPGCEAFPVGFMICKERSGLPPRASLGGQMVDAPYPNVLVSSRPRACLQARRWSSAPSAAFDATSTMLSCLRAGCPSGWQPRAVSLGRGHHASNIRGAEQPTSQLDLLAFWRVPALRDPAPDREVRTRRSSRTPLVRPALATGQARRRIRQQG